jgi:hypothetical protein
VNKDLSEAGFHLSKCVPQTAFNKIAIARKWAGGRVVKINGNSPGGAAA